MKGRIGKALVVRQSQPNAGLESVKALVLDAMTSPHSKASYRIALDAFLSWFRSEWKGPFNRAACQAWKSSLLAAGLSPATVCARLAAVKKLASEAELNTLLDPVVAAGIAKTKGPSRQGVRIGNWLSREQTQAVIDAPDTSTLVGKRDRALLAVLFGAGLRREETCFLTFEHIQQREGRWVVADIVGKRGRVRAVPIADWVKLAIDEWATAAGISSGIVFRVAYSVLDHNAVRTMREAGRKWKEIAAALGVNVGTIRRAYESQSPVSRLMLGRPLTPQAIFKAVKRNAAKLGLVISPHDCRRTFAKLARRGGSPIEQIKCSLGHGSVLTTERYLGIEQDLTDSPADRLGLGPPSVRRQSMEPKPATPDADVRTCVPSAAPLPSDIQKAYARDWRDFERWCSEKGLAPLPAEPSTVALYLADRSHLKPGTLHVRLTAITHAHHKAGFESSPASQKHAVIAEALKNIRRAKGAGNG